MMRSQPVKGTWNKSARRFTRAGFMPRKPLIAPRKTSSGPYRVDVLFNIRSVCPAASAFAVAFAFNCPESWRDSARGAKRARDSAPRLDLGTINNKSPFESEAVGLRAFKNQGVLGV